MKIGLDVMGGDFAPKATIKGACLALNEISAIRQDCTVRAGRSHPGRTEAGRR